MKSKKVFEETFQIFDKDCDGFISPVEIRTVMNGLGFFPCEENIRKSIEMADNDSEFILPIYTLAVLICRV